MLRFLRLFSILFLLMTSLLLSAQEASDESPFTLHSESPIANMNGDAGAMIFHDGRYHMFANVYDTLPSQVAIHHFISSNAVNWIQISVEPILTVEAYTALASDVLITEDGTWLLYLSTWANETDFAPTHIGLASAESPDGEWTIIDEQLLSPSSDSWDSAFTYAPAIVQTDNGYAMYYTGGNAEDELAIGYATSADGISWTKQDAPLLTTLGSASIRPIWQLVWQPTVIETSLGYFMLFKSGRELYENGGGMLRHGQSNDGITWQLDVLQQSLTLEETGGDAIGWVQALNVEGVLHLYLSVEIDGVSQIYLATFEEVTIDASILDVGNNNNASDIEIKLPTIENYEIHIRPTDSDSSQALDSAHYTVTESHDSSNIYIHLLETATDSDANPIIEGIPYTIEVFDTISGDLLLAQELTLQNAHTVRTVIAGLDAAAGGLDIDAEGNIYFADFGERNRTAGQTVYQITPDGQVNPFLEGNGLQTATGNVFDEQGNFYQSGYNSDNILRVAPDGEVSIFAEDNIEGPVGLVFDSEGNLFAANCNDGTIARITPEGETSIFARDILLRCANGITIDNDSNLYVANFRNGDVIKITPEGEVTRLANLPGLNNGHILYRDGLLYTVARGAHQIYTIGLDGEVTLLAGTGQRGNADGDALQATFSLPNDLIFSTDGSELYINEGDALTTGRNHPALVRAIVFAR